MKNKIFKFLSFVLALLVVLNFVACESSSDTEKKQQEKIEKLEKQIKKLKHKEKDVEENHPDIDKEHYVIATDIGFSPFEFEDENGDIVGIDMDILDAIADDQDFTYEISYIGWDPAIAACQSGMADGMIAAASITEDRKDSGWIFSDGYFDATVGMAVKGDSVIEKPEDLEHKIVAVKSGTSAHMHAESIKDKYGFEIVRFETSPEMYRAVMGGAVDACFDDAPILKYVINSSDIDMKYVEGGENEPVQYGMAVFDSDKQELIDKFNEGLKNIRKNGKYDKILEKYLG